MASAYKLEGTSICPNCGSKEIRVVDKRDGKYPGIIRRRKSCEECGTRFNTYEVTTGDLEELLYYYTAGEARKSDQLVMCLNRLQTELGRMGQEVVGAQALISVK